MLLRGISKSGTVHLSQPEEQAADVCVTTQVTKILPSDERAVVFRIDEQAVVEGIGLDVVISQPVHHSAATALVEEIDEISAL